MPDRPLDPPATLPDDYRLSRRGAAAALAAGYAVLATAADAEPITTPTDGLVIEDIVMAGGLPGHVVRPAAAGRHPAVIVVSEIFGVHQWIRDICRRLARAGYVAVAPGFFHRADPGNTLPALTDMTAVRAIVATAGLDLQMADVRTTLAWLAAQPFAAPGRTAITGFCWGGAVTWMSAILVPGIKAGGAWYGRLSGGDDTSRPYPLTAVDQIKCPVLGLYGALDRGIPVSDVEAMNKALAASPNPQAKASRIKLYADADHGFLADYRPSFNAAAATDAWGLLLAHFKAHV
jgi:carboxymethylenebutenolidase